LVIVSLTPLKTVLHKADTRGEADHGWLKSRHTFSFASYQSPERTRFGLLRVLNDDHVAPAMGFGTHPHDNMEIVSIPLSGALRHNDSTGREAIIHSGDVQIMSAGRGISHSEVNASRDEHVDFLQIWVYPKEMNIEPRYEQKTFLAKDRLNRLQTVVSPNHEEGGNWINQQAWFYLADLEAGNSLSVSMHGENQGLYFFVLDGALNVADTQLGKRDGLGVYELDSQALEIKATADTKLLVIEVPMN
jgi:quercetin 2,3-dioxygenase